MKVVAHFKRWLLLYAAIGLFFYAVMYDTPFSAILSMVLCFDCVYIDRLQRTKD